MSNKKAMHEIEELVARYLDQQIVQPRVKLYRMTIAGDRVYYYFDEQGEPVFKQSVTTVIRDNTPTSPFLIKWIGDNGTEGAEEIRDTRAAFGTFMHICIEDYLLNNEFDLDALDEKIEAYAEMERLPLDFGKKHSREAKKAILAFAAFADEYNVQPVAVEMSLAHPEFDIAGMLDLVCEMTIKEKGHFGEKYKSGPNKGKPKETYADIKVRGLVDFKSGKNFYDDHVMQLEIYRLIWNANFPQYQIDRIFNWAPADWRTAPSFKFTEQTGKKIIRKIPLILELNEIDQEDKDRSATVFSGKISRGCDLSKNVQRITYREAVKNKRDEENEEQTPKTEEQ